MDPVPCRADEKEYTHNVEVGLVVISDKLI